VLLLERLLPAAHRSHLGAQYLGGVAYVGTCLQHIGAVVEAYLPHLLQRVLFSLKREPVVFVLLLLCLLLLSLVFSLLVVVLLLARLLLRVVEHHHLGFEPAHVHLCCAYRCPKARQVVTLHVAW
jgi:TRAP-type C4-dicarboxylate transport system permease large subunit